MSCDPLTAFLNCCQNCSTTSATSVPIFYRVFTTSKWAWRAFSRFKRFKSLSTAHPVRTKKQNGFRVLFHSHNLLVQQVLEYFPLLSKLVSELFCFCESILGKKRCLWKENEGEKCAPQRTGRISWRESITQRALAVSRKITVMQS